MSARRVAVLAAAALVAVGTVACSSSSDGALSHSIRPLEPPASTATTAPAPTSTTIPCEPRASFRPDTDSVPDPSQFAPGSTMATIRKNNMLVVGVDEGTQGWGFRDPKSADIKGLDVDLLGAVAEAIFRDGNPGAHLKFKTLTTAERIAAVKNGDVDMVASLLTATCGRWQDVDFSTEYYEAHQDVLVPADSTVSSLADLAGKTVCATRGSTSIEHIHEMVPKANLFPVAARSDCLVALQEGEVDAITSDDTILASFQAQEKRTTTRLLDNSSFQPEPYAIAIAKGHEDLVRFVNSVLEQMREDGALQQLYTQWLGDSVPDPPAPEYLP